ncbi:hypothetical protein [Natronoglycomyces albus]|uniref:Uncharacterized protein n=1 Tax=Natronoglycomyces albus TaxID=2811108 RepID=A0A895XES2_9ACTN|nr:hypothetical protein [Natronoglycomyces albus]QSB04331.1 hypothetical protein JQS30_11045 [Natronoglycomyces albus]
MLGDIAEARPNFWVSHLHGATHNMLATHRQEALNLIRQFANPTAPGRDEAGLG